MIKLNCVLLSSLIMAMLLGCGDSGFPKTYKVSGTVKLGGKPVDGALVTFQPSGEGKSAVGSTNDKGEFKLSTFGPGDGAMPGSYKVTITKTAAPLTTSKPTTPPPGTIASGDLSPDYAPPSGNEGSKVSGGGAPKNLLPAKYASDATSGLIATVVEANTNNFDFDL